MGTPLRVLPVPLRVLPVPLRVLPVHLTDAPWEPVHNLGAKKFFVFLFFQKCQIWYIRILTVASKRIFRSNPSLRSPFKNSGAAQKWSSDGEQVDRRWVRKLALSHYFSFYRPNFFYGPGFGKHIPKFWAILEPDPDPDGPGAGRGAGPGGSKSGQNPDLKWPHEYAHISGFPASIRALHTPKFRR